MAEEKKNKIPFFFWEILLVLLLIGLFGYIQEDGDLFFHGYSPHPFLALELLIVIRYGLQAGFITSLLLSAVYLISGQLEGLLTSYFWTLENFLVPIQLVVAGAVLGEFKDRDLERVRYFREKMAEKEKKLKELQESFQNLLIAKDKISQRILEDQILPFLLKQLLENFQKSSHGEGISHLFNFLENQMEVSQVALYYKINHQFHLMGKRRWDDLPFQLTKEFEENHPLFSKALKTQKTVSMKDLKKGEKDELVFVVPFKIKEETRALLLIKNLPFLHFHQRSRDILDFLSILIGFLLEENHPAFPPIF
ncbi:MAG: hypothetical protein D6785_14135 [Planctomycetota bacterium]|nr:MAG: hypothetical protein D6785_14135 [Planctomycetota bacterium]